MRWPLHLEHKGPPDRHLTSSPLEPTDEYLLDHNHTRPPLHPRFHRCGSSCRPRSRTHRGPAHRMAAGAAGLRPRRPADHRGVPPRRVSTSADRRWRSGRLVRLRHLGGRSGNRDDRRGQRPHCAREDRDPIRCGIAHEKTATRFAAEEVAEAFIDGDQLVLVDHTARELSRTTTEASLESGLRAAFESHGYDWYGRADPREAAFIPWVDRDAHCGADDHALLRARQRALTDRRTGEAATLRDELSARGIVVRDRGGAQQIRLLGE